MAQSLKIKRNVGFKRETSAIETAMRADWANKSYPRCTIAKLCHSQAVPWPDCAILLVRETHTEELANISYSTVLWSPIKTIGEWKHFIASPERMHILCHLQHTANMYKALRGTIQNSEQMPRCVAEMAARYKARFRVTNVQPLLAFFFKWDKCIPRIQNQNDFQGK